MTQITCTTPVPEYFTEPDECWPVIGDILITIGQKHLATLNDDDMTDWMTLSEVAGLCRCYRYALPYRSYRAKALAPDVIALFSSHDSIELNGVKVRYRSELKQVGNADAPKAVHYLKFYRVPL